MSFVHEFNALRLPELVRHSLATPSENISGLLRRTEFGLKEFAELISPAASQQLEALCAKSQRITRQRFWQGDPDVCTALSLQ